MNQIAITIIYDNRKENQAMQEGWDLAETDCFFCTIN